MKNEFYFQINVTQEQVIYAKKLVEYSMKHHTIPNIWDGTNAEKNTVELRFTGSLGEIIFADTYQTKRPERSFGADDGQDLGKDFELEIEGEKRNFDIKTMRRKSNVFYSDYVLNIPASQLHKDKSLTDFYFHINIHREKEKGYFIATFVGYASKEAIKEGKIGQLYKAGTWRTRGNNTKFQFHQDTYEIDLINLKTPIVNDFIKAKEGFRIRKIKMK